ncbi:hypothetical protein QT971_00705 [Microcoleus sp. herbarium19]|uniref:hypothetical protein n=1 Tax=unclassified Microcoleus TaxID=2642155 RepID=UPI002FD3A841
MFADLILSIAIWNRNLENYRRITPKDAGVRSPFTNSIALSFPMQIVSQISLTNLIFCVKTFKF